MATPTQSATTVCLVIPALPWLFGPYQQQGFQLSKQLADLGFKILWLPKTYQLPERVFDSNAEVAQVAGVEAPPANFDDDHINYIGATTGRRFHKISDFNRLAIKYKIDAYISLMDLNMILNDIPFEVPAISWYPNHFEQVPPKDAHALSAFSAVASLCPSAAKMIAAQLACEGCPIVEYIPHIVEMNKQLWDQPKYQLLAKYHPEIPSKRFLVLLQGGNYEPHNRKGWDSGILAFKQFQDENPHIHAHLLIHAISSVEILRDAGTHVSNDQPQSGLSIQLLIEAVQLEPGTYTLDTRILPLEQSLALKRMADVVLHPSKSEGFGMNVLESQAIGTPVITTKFQAMADFTKYGISVEPAQKSFMVQGLVADPDISGCAEAILQIYENDFEETLVETREWLEENFSPEAVGGRMAGLLKKLGVTPSKSQMLVKKKVSKPKEYANSFYTIMSDQTPRRMDWITPWTLSANSDTEFNHDVIQALLSDMIGSDVTIIIVPVTAVDESIVALEARDGKLNPDLAILVRSELFKSAQMVHSSRRYIIMDIAGKAKDVKQMPVGLAKVKGEETPTPKIEEVNDEL